MIKDIKKVFEEYKFLRIIMLVLTIFVIVMTVLHYLLGNTHRYKMVDGSEYDYNMHYSYNLNKHNIDIEYPKEYNDTGNKQMVLQKGGDGYNPDKRCLLIIDNVSYKNIDNLIIKMSELYKTDYEEVELNGQTYYYLQENHTYNNEYYLTEYKNKILLINMEYNKESCKEELDGIVKTIKLK